MAPSGIIKKTIETINHETRRELLKMSVTQAMEQYQSILEEEVHTIGWETSAVKSKGKLDAATLVQMTIFGFWQDPNIRLSGLPQIAGRREAPVRESAIGQRFTPEH